MSEPIPESIPTSQDPRSKRPTKKRALTPVSAQAATLSALFAKPEQEIRIPSSASPGLKAAPGSAPPEIVANVQGSSAGAGSGEFHVYKASRRREYERLRRMDEEVRGEKEAEEFEVKRSEREEKDREKTRRNREKREKMRARKGRGKGDSGGAEEGKEEVVGGEILKGPRVDVKDGESPEDEIDRRGLEDVTQEAGLIIHDDD